MKVKLRHKFQFFSFLSLILPSYKRDRSIPLVAPVRTPTLNSSEDATRWADVSIKQTLEPSEYRIETPKLLTGVICIRTRVVNELDGSTTRTP